MSRWDRILWRFHFFESNKAGIYSTSVIESGGWKSQSINHLGWDWFWKIQRGIPPWKNSFTYLLPSINFYLSWTWNSINGRLFGCTTPLWTILCLTSLFKPPKGRAWWRYSTYFGVWKRELNEKIALLHEWSIWHIG